MPASSVRGILAKRGTADRSSRWPLICTRQVLQQLTTIERVTTKGGAVSSFWYATTQSLNSELSPDMSIHLGGMTTFSLKVTKVLSASDVPSAAAAFCENEVQQEIFIC